MSDPVTSLYERFPQSATPGPATSQLSLDFDTVIKHCLSHPPTPETALARVGGVDCEPGVLGDDGPVHLV